MAAILHCLGNFRLCAAGDGADLSPRGRKARALVAYLALNGGSVGRERLAGLLWSERGEDQARASLRNTLLELRDLSTNGRAVLMIEREHVGTVSSRLATDLGQLQAWAASGDLAAVDACLASWDGRIFADLDSIDAGFDEWLAGERTRQQEKMFAAVIGALEMALSSERVEHVRSIADKLLQVEPTNEVIVRLAMRADQSASDVSAIRRRYKRLEDQLRTEFNATPSADTRRLYNDLVVGSSADVHANAAASSISNGQVEPAATSETAPQGPTARGSTFSAWRRVAAAAIVAAVGAAAIGVTASYDWKSRYTADLVELRPFGVIDGKAAMDALTRQIGASVKRVLVSNQVDVVDGGAAGSPGGASGGQSEFILSGVIEARGDEYAVTLYLDNRADGQTLWSQQFSRAAADIEGLRDEIGANAAYIIACSLKQRSAAREKLSTPAFKIYVETCDPNLYGEDHQGLLATAQRLVAVAPNDAYAHGLAAIAFAQISHVPAIGKAQAEGYVQAARIAAARALELDPASPFAPVANASLATRRERWRALDAYTDQVGIAHPAVRGPYIWELANTGRLKEARFAAEQTVALAPLSGACRAAQATVYMLQGDAESAERIYEETVRLWPGKTSAPWLRFLNAALNGEPKVASAFLDRGSGLPDLTHGQRACWQAFIGARARGAHGDDRAAVRKACDGQLDNIFTTRLRAALGDIEGAYEEMQDRPLGPNQWPMSFFSLGMTTFRKDARFMSLFAETGLLEFWIESDRWPDFCSDRDLPYSCKDAAAAVLARKKARGVAVSD